MAKPLVRTAKPGVLCSGPVIHRHVMDGHGLEEIAQRVSASIEQVVGTWRSWADQQLSPDEFAIALAWIETDASFVTSN